jgi:mRNA interferase RelE/StbE
MKTYKFESSKKFDKQFDKLDRNNQKSIAEYIRKNLINTENPRATGKALKGNRKGIWRYRVGYYRILCDIQDKKLIILALELGDRKEVYR